MKRIFLFALCFSATITLFLIPVNSVLAFEPLFYSSMTYAAGSGPRSVFAGDLDGDSDLDLAVANSGSDNVSWFVRPLRATANRALVVQMTGLVQAVSSRR